MSQLTSEQESDYPVPLTGISLVSLTNEQYSDKTFRPAICPAEELESFSDTLIQATPVKVTTLDIIN